MIANTGENLRCACSWKDGRVTGLCGAHANFMHYLRERNKERTDETETETERPSIVSTAEQFRATRVLVYTGTKEWIDRTFEGGQIKLGEIRVMANGCSIKETERKIEHL